MNKRWIPIRIAELDGSITQYTVLANSDTISMEEAKKLIRDCATLDALFPLPKNSLIN